MKDGVGGAPYCAGLAVLKFDVVTDRGANAVKALGVGLEIPAPYVLLAEGKADLKEDGGAFADGGGRGGSEEGGCGVVEDDLRPGGGGKDMMNGCPEERWTRYQTYRSTISKRSLLQLCPVTRILVGQGQQVSASGWCTVLVNETAARRAGQRTV